MTSIVVRSASVLPVVTITKGAMGEREANVQASQVAAVALMPWSSPGRRSLAEGGARRPDREAASRGVAPQSSVKRMRAASHIVEAV